MDGIIQFLIVAAILAMGVARQVKKEAAKNQSRPAPLPEEVIVPPKSSKNKSEKKSPKPFISEGQLRGLTQSEGEAAIAAPDDAAPAEASGTDSEYALRSADDARRAIIWSEILQRKY
jgi:hypothetical protein